MNRFLFLDRDGTIIREPKDFRVTSFEKLVFLPKVISSLYRLYSSGFQLVIVTNQDLLGTNEFPYESFLEPHNKMIEIFEGEGIHFFDVLIDHHTKDENHPNRKPNTGLVQPLLNNNSIDLSNSYMIGDRFTDAIFAKNIGCNSITIKDKNSNEGDYREYIYNQQVHDDINTIIFENWYEITNYILKRI